MENKFKVGDYILNEWSNDEDKVTCPICGFKNDTNYDVMDWYCENCDSQFHMTEVNEIIEIGKYKSYFNKIEPKKCILEQSNEGEKQ